VKRRAYIGLGSNQGDPNETLDAAVAALRTLERSEFVAASPRYVSAPIDAPGPDYLNAVVAIDTELEPYGLLLHLLDIEIMLGRKRRGEKKNAPRKADLDLLLLGDLIMHSTPLTVPHPRLHQRAFVLRPLLDLAPDLHIPGRGAAADLLAEVADQRVEPAPSAAPPSAEHAPAP
jgi:2-amino-4-hydroxy-6-hydroxymethyldihydropteridine diphosphokinase